MECCKVYTEKNSSCKKIPHHSWQYGEILNMLEKTQTVLYVKETRTNWKINFARNRGNHKESSCIILNRFPKDSTGKDPPVKQ